MIILKVCDKLYTTIVNAYIVDDVKEIKFLIVLFDVLQRVILKKKTICERRTLSVEVIQ